MISRKHSENSAFSRRPGPDYVRHVPVLLETTVRLLNLEPGQTVLDLTVGGGGHAAALLEATTPDGRLIGFDADPDTLEHARRRLARYGDRVRLIHANFRDCQTVLHDQLPSLQLRAVLLDLGLSSLALGAAHSRFSFLTDGPLDFRFDPTSGQLTAADIVNRRSESELARILREYGEEREAARIARAIVTRRKVRPFTRTRELTEAILGSVRSGHRSGRIHPATKTFQALRIAVNDELSALRETLPAALQLLEPGGRIAVIAYHSLEDRIVKEYFRTESRGCLCPPEQPTCTCRHKAVLRLITRHPISPSSAEQITNPRSRSAKLRVAEKLQ